MKFEVGDVVWNLKDNCVVTIGNTVKDRVRCAWFKDGKLIVKFIKIKDLNKNKYKIHKLMQEMGYDK